MPARRTWARPWRRRFSGRPTTNSAANNSGRPGRDAEEPGRLEMDVAVEEDPEGLDVSTAVKEEPERWAWP